MRIALLLCPCLIAGCAAWGSPVGRFENSKLAFNVSAHVRLPRHSVRVKDWAQRPTASQIAAAYPDGAPDYGYGGVSCAVDSSHKLTNCKAEDVSPANRGFEDAFTKLAEQFQLPSSISESGEITEVSMTMQLYDRSAYNPVTNPIPCKPPFCLVEHAAPPPNPHQPRK